MLVCLSMYVILTPVSVYTTHAAVRGVLVLGRSLRGRETEGDHGRAES